MTTPQRSPPRESSVSDPAYTNETAASARAPITAPMDDDIAHTRRCVCPCCGAKVAGDLRCGCTACGARSVGQPLVPPAIRLPRLGRAVAACIAGTGIALWFSASTVIELFSGARADFGFWRIVSAAETAAWKLKWSLLPAALISVVVGARYALYAQAAAGEAPFGGRRFARAGVFASTLVAVLMVALLVVTIPERQRRSEVAQAAHARSLEYAVQAAMMRYQTMHDSLPTDLDSLRDLPDEDGTIRFVLANFDANAYTPSSVQATARAPKSRLRKTIRLRTASYNRNSNSASDATPSGGLTFTNYDLVWAGIDKIPGTEDDRIMRDGRFIPTPANGVVTPYAAQSEPSPAPAHRVTHKGTQR